MKVMLLKLRYTLKNIAIAKVEPNSERSTQDGTQNLQEMLQKIITMIQQNNKTTRKNKQRKRQIKSDEKYAGEI